MNDNENEEDELVILYEEMKETETFLFFDVEEFEHLIYYYEDLDDLNESLEIIKLAKNQHPNDVDILFCEVKILSHLGRLNEALEVIKLLEILNKNDVFLTLLKATIIGKTGDKLKAISILKSYIKQTTDNVEIYELLLTIRMLYKEMPDTKNAVKYLKLAISIKPKKEGEFILYELFYNLSNKKELFNSIPFIKDYINKKPYSKEAWYILGEIYSKLNNIEQALEALEYAIAIDNSFIDPYRSKYYILSDQKKYLLAKETMQEILKYIDDKKYKEEIYIKLAYCYENMDENINAKKYYKKALKLNPKLSQIWMYLSMVNFKELNFSESLSMIKTAVNIEKENVVYNSFMAKVQESVGLINESIKTYEKLISELNVEKTEIIIKLTDLLFENDREEKAFKVLESWIYKKPKEAKLFYRLAAYLLTINKTKEAIPYLEEGLNINKKEIESFSSYYPKFINHEEILNIINK